MLSKMIDDVRITIWDDGYPEWVEIKNNDVTIRMHPDAARDLIYSLTDLFKKLDEKKAEKRR